MSPTVFRAHGMRFFFFTREESRPHIHVAHAGCEAKFWLEPAIEIAHNHGLNPRRLARPGNWSGSIWMRSARLGRSSSAVEVLGISGRGVRLALDGRELLMPFEQFPWFREATVAEILDVERPAAGHLRWPRLDIDLAVDSIEHPERYPLLAPVVPQTKRRVMARHPAKRGS